MRLSHHAARALPWLALAALAACSSRSRPVSMPAEAAALASVHHGQLVDVYGVAEPNGVETLQPYARDLLVGHQLPEHGLPGEPPLYELLANNSETGKSRIAIRFPVGTPAFDAALTKLQAGVGTVDLHGSSELREVPWHAALELRFTAPLGVDDGELDPAGAIRIAPRDQQPLPVRVVARGDRLIVAPSPPSGGDTTLQVALAIGGPVLPGLDNVVLDLELVPATPSSTSVQRGPRIVGELGFFLERVDRLGEGVQEVTVFKNGISHDIDRGDHLRLFVQGQSVPAVVTEILSDPTDDNLQPSVQHVRTRVLRSEILERIDPSNLPGYPGNPQSPAGEAWLIANAPRAVLVADYQAEQNNGMAVEPRDDLRNFVTFTPSPLVMGSPTAPNENLSPFAGAIVRFSSPINLATARPLDTLFFATRDVLDPVEQQTFIALLNIDPNTFRAEKYATPHLVHSRLFEQSGQQRVLRLQPPLGFYLDEEMRRIDDGQPFANKRFKYYLHIVGGQDGLMGQNGLPLEFGNLLPTDHVALPFSLDTRKKVGGAPVFPDNRVATVARRFAALDEDEQPSYYLQNEVQSPGTRFNPNSFELADLSGAVVHLTDGTLSARPTARVRQIVDDLNQWPPPPQNTELRHCPAQIAGEQQVPIATAALKYTSPIQNPLNPYGSRMQAVWREIDMSLARHDPNDFNLDVEAMYWGPFTGVPAVFDEFDRVSLFFGHSENRPENCLGAFSALPTMPRSPAWSRSSRTTTSRTATSPAARCPAQRRTPRSWDRRLVIDPARAVTEPNGVNHYLPLPEFEAPYFVWRDERVMQQGASSAAGNDALPFGVNYEPYILSPFLAGRGRLVTDTPSGPQFNFGAWDNRENFSLAQPSLPDQLTGGLVGSVGLPLMMDFWMYPSLSSKGSNGWQISLSVPSSSTPNFRAYSGGGLVQGTPRTVSPSTPGWQTAEGGYTLTGSRTQPTDNAVYWVMADFLKQTTVATAGFVDITDPHRMASAFDPRLGPYFAGGLPQGTTAFFTWDVAHAGEGQVPGTQVAVEFRGAGPVDPQPWAAIVNGYNPSRFQEQPDPVNFPLDPLKAGDAHIRKFDDRPRTGAPPRNTWTRYYNEIVTDYTSDLNQLMDPAFTMQFAGPTEQFQPEDVRYFNWRFIMQNARDDAARAPRLDSFVLSYRLQ